MNTLFSAIALAILAVTFVSMVGLWWGIVATLGVVLVFAVLRRRSPATEAASRGDDADGVRTTPAIELIRLLLIGAVSGVTVVWLGWWSLPLAVLLGVVVGMSRRWLRTRSAH